MEVIKEELHEIFAAALREFVKNNMSGFSYFSLGLISGVMATVYYSGKHLVINDSIFGMLDADNAAFLQLQKRYAINVKNMKEGTKRHLEEYKNPDTTEDKKKKILGKIISFYLSPRSTDLIFGRNMVIYNGKFKPTILTQEDHMEVYLMQLEILQLAGVEQKVKKYRIGEDAYAWDQKTYEAAMEECGLQY